MYDCDSSDIPYAYVYNEQFKDCISGILDNFTFALCTYLIAVEYMDYNLQERMKELGVTSHKKKEAIIGPKVIGQDIENLKERIGL